MSRRADYSRYLQSPHWAERRLRRLDLAKHRCEFRPMLDWHNADPIYGERCAETRNLEVHHRSYENLGREQDHDLEVLCRLHHLVRHLSGLECFVCGLL
jgi:hypothetical protein